MKVETKMFLFEGYVRIYRCFVFELHRHEVGQLHFFFEILDKNLKFLGIFIQKVLTCFIYNFCDLI